MKTYKHSLEKIRLKKKAPYLNIGKVIKANEKRKKTLYTGIDATDDFYKTKLNAAGTLMLKNKKAGLFIYMMGFFAKLENC